MEGLEALARKFQYVDDFDTNWDCKEFLMKLKIDKDQENELELLLREYCKSNHQLQDLYKKIKDSNETCNHDDNDCSGFDEMEQQWFWESTF